MRNMILKNQLFEGGVKFDPPSVLKGLILPLQARIWFDFSWVRRQKWMGGMKLGPIVYEKKGKSKSNNGPFVGTIWLKVPGTL